MDKFAEALEVMDDDAIQTLLKRTERHVYAMSMADLADMRIADAYSGDVLDRNFERTQSAKFALTQIKQEIARRASLSQSASPRPGEAPITAAIEVGCGGKADHD